MTVAAQAIRLATQYPVFPCRADKRPACPHGFKDASRDPDCIADLWRRCPGPLIGIPTGEASDFDALDIDPRHGGADWLQEAEPRLPLTQINHTRSGGFHYLFRHLDGVKNTASKIAPGVDTRGDGGYVIWWPAHGCDQLGDAIEPWPRWLLDILMPPRVKRAPPFRPATRAEASTRAALMIERAYQRVRSAAPGQRHYELRAAAATLGGLMRYLDASPADLERQLVDLVMATGGQDRVNAEKTARWALDRGQASPLLTT